jgi:hypothetical protein
MQDVYLEENHLFDVLNEEISLKNVFKAVVSVNSEKREKVIIFIAENLNYLMFENDWFDMIENNVNLYCDILDVAVKLKMRQISERAQIELFKPIEPLTLEINFKHMLNDNLSKDIVFTLDCGRSLRAHSFPLIAVSNYFKKLIHSKPERERFNLKTIPVHQSIETMTLIIRYAYTGEILINEENLLYILEAADK